MISGFGGTATSFCIVPPSIKFFSHYLTEEFPIWWYIAPTIINTFLESYDFSGKTVVLFATSGGSGMGKTADGLKGSVAADTVIVEGKLLNGRQSAKDLKVWVDSLDV